MDNKLATIASRPSNAQTTLAATTVTVPVAAGRSSKCAVPECRKTNHKWCCGPEQCPMCHRFRKSFHCNMCVNKGDFGHSSTVIDRGRFFKKQMKFQNIVYSSNSFKNDCAKMFSNKQCNMLKKIEISILQEKLRLLKFTISDKNKLLIDKQNQLKKIKLEICNQKSRVDRYAMRVVQLEDFTKCQETVLNDITCKLYANRPKLKNIIKTRIKQLVIYIFTLDEVGNSNIIQNDEVLGVNNSLSHALAEASKLTYVCGQWINGDEWTKQTKLGYCIVAPILPANGDYSAYNEWVSDKNFTFHQTFAELNPAWSISAGLTYTSQFVKQLSFFLNVFLPRRPNFSEFCGNELSEIRFSKYVTHLNANVLYLCFSQNVDPKFLHPDHTLKNLMKLLDTSISDLGRFDPPDINVNLCNAFEEKISIQLFSSDCNSESEEENYYEWETVPNIEFISSQTQLSLQSTSSVVRSGLVASTAASLASIWRRGWTK